MLILGAPKNYSELLSKLGFWTFLTTSIFLAVLTSFGLVPIIPISNKFIPSSGTGYAWLDLLVSLGIIPIVGGLIAGFLSSTFEVHNKISKLIGLRYIWEKWFIVSPMLKRVGISEKLNKAKVEEIMSEVFYREVKHIDEHYVHVFWRYAFQFWVIFEHLIVVSITFIILLVVYELPVAGIKLLSWYLLSCFVVATLHWRFVVTKKSQDQAEQIPLNAIIEYVDSRKQTCDIK